LPIFNTEKFAFLAAQDTKKFTLQIDVRKKILENRAVLFVDDEEITLQVLQRSLNDEVYDKYFAKSGKEALEILRQKEVHVIVVDMVMPGMGGLELLKIISKEYPKVISIALSGYAQPIDVITTMYGEGVYKFISKPLTPDDDLRKIIRQAINNYDLQSEHEEMVAELEHYSGRQISTE
jgi:DNA-binding NtrC family response regulator